MAAERIAEAVSTTPIELSDRLSALTGAQVYLKREDLQAVRSYKLRGAYNLMAQLDDRERAAGVVLPARATTRRVSRSRAGRWEITAGSTCRPRRPKQKRDRIRCTAASSSS